MNAFDRLHASYVAPRRVRVLCERVAPLMPHGASVLDVGCGDGRLSAQLLKARPDLTLRGLDVLIRPVSAIPIEPFDGRALPVGAGSVDVVLFVDTLHHAQDPVALLQEARRVARQAIVIKDHVGEGIVAQWTLRFMDRVGNVRFGVRMPHAYWSRRQWQEAFASVGVTVGFWEDRLGLYPWPASVAFERSLHFLARLDVVRSPASKEPS